MNKTIIDAINALKNAQINLNGKQYIFKSYTNGDDTIVATHNGIDVRIELNTLLDNKSNDNTIVTEQVTIDEKQILQDNTQNNEQIPQDIRQLFTGKGQTGGYDGITLNSITDFNNFNNIYQYGRGISNFDETTIGNLSELYGKKNNNINFLHNYLMKGGSNKFAQKINYKYENDFNSSSSDYCE